MFVYTYSHYCHKLFFSYKKRKAETLFPSQKKKGAKKLKPLTPVQVQPHPCHSPVLSNESFSSYVQVASTHPRLILTNCKLKN